MIAVTSEYALRAAVYLAQCHPTQCTTAEIAAATQVPAGYLSKIMQSLVRAGVVTSQRGLGGGFHLSKSPGSISVLDVIVAMGAPMGRIHHCPLGLSTHTKLCRLHRLVDDAAKQMEEIFGSATLSSLLPGDSGIEPLCEVSKASPSRRAKAVQSIKSKE